MDHLAVKSSTAGLRLSEPWKAKELMAMEKWTRSWICQQTLGISDSGGHFSS